MDIERGKAILEKLLADDVIQIRPSDRERFMDDWREAMGLIEQAPASGEVEPVAWECSGEPGTKPDVVTSMAAADHYQHIGRTVRPLVYADAHPPAKVPEWIPKTLGKLADSIRGDCYMGEEWELRTIDSVLSSLRDTPAPATTSETEWVKPTGRKHHDLKTDPSVFRQSLNGVKAWEIRRDDRDFVRGDTVTLHETENTGEEMAEGAPLVYTGRKITGVIGFVLNGPAYGLKPDWCVFSLLPTPPTAQEGE